MNINHPISINPDNLQLPVLLNSKLQPIVGNICFDPITKNIYINDGTSVYSFLNSSIPPSLTTTNQHFNFMQNKTSINVNYSGLFGFQFFDIYGAATAVNKYDPYSIFTNSANIGTVSVNNNISGVSRVFVFSFSASVKSISADLATTSYQIQLFYNNIVLTTLCNFSGALIQANFILPVAGSTSYTLSPQGLYQFVIFWTGGDGATHTIEFDWVNCGVTVWPLSSI